jgi:hypothetical protein
MLFPTESEVLAYLDEKNISDLEEGDYFQMDDGQWCLYRTDVYCNCEGCSENFMYNDEDDKGGYCGECYMCADCGCKCDEEESEEEDGFEDCVCGYTHNIEDKCPNEATAHHFEKWQKHAKEENDFCPICNVLTNTQNCATSKSCCVCLEITFCDDCVKKCKGDDCSHSWETHHICARCEEDEKKINLTQGA